MYLTSARKKPVKQAGGVLSKKAYQMRRQGKSNLRTENSISRPIVAGKSELDRTLFISCAIKISLETPDTQPSRSSYHATLYQSDHPSTPARAVTSVTCIYSLMNHKHKRVLMNDVSTSITTLKIWTVEKQVDTILRLNICQHHAAFCFG